MKNMIAIKNNFSIKRLYLFTLGIPLIIAVMPSFVHAQKKNKGQDKLVYALAIQGKAYEDSIVLRWAAGDPVTWQMAMGKGYTLKRVTITPDGKSGDTILLTKAPIYPQSLEKMKSIAKKDDKYMAIAAQAMYGKNFTLGAQSNSSASFTDKIRQASDMFTLRYYFSLQSADLSKEAATALGFRWVDKDVKKGGRYVYFISSDTANKSYEITPGHTIVFNVVLPEKPYPIGVEAIPSDSKIELHWLRNQPYGFTSYYIERSSDGGKTYIRLNKEPFNSVYQKNMENSADSAERTIGSILKNAQVFIDSIPQNYKDYYYRIAGIDAFADISAFSAPVKTHGIDKTPPTPVLIISADNIKLNHILIKWKEQSKSTDLLGYYVARGNNTSGPFYPLTDDLLSKNATQYTDTTASALQQNYYVVVSVDTAKNISYSLPRVAFLKDSIPPIAPTGIEGSMDTMGYVALRWNKNKEPDLAGYRVYISYNKNGVYNIASKYIVKENYFLDSISTQSLDRSVYYKVVAVDKNGNHSKFSNPATIHKPIMIPPTSPVANKIEAHNGKIIIEWIGSSSEGVFGYDILRQEKGKPNWQSIGFVLKNKKSDKFNFTDTSIAPNTAYFYSAVTVDSTGIKSEKSHPAGLKEYNVELLPKVDNIKAQYNSKSNAVELSWAYDAGNKEDLFFLVYRAENNGDLILWDSKPINDKSITDRNISKGKTYRYSIEVKQKKGKLRSGYSKEVKISI